ncbi:MAG: SAM-dependent chlorinase/fluorinase [Chloroflexi bacterium]|nr:SAM-dependent chlorinase/fluorinase [Chloroflexota bacterium]
MNPSGVITLTTDFGGGGGVLRGVIWGIAPHAQVADLTHAIEPQNIRMAAWYLTRQVFFFPEGSVHVAVVDPGVGTPRRPLAVQAGPQYFVGPDNGLFTPFYEMAEERGWPLKVVHTDNPDYWLSKVSDVFHGRDIFAPVAAHLARGVPIEDLGTPVTAAVRVPFPRPQRNGDELHGEVILLYRHLGNIITNIDRPHLNGIDPAGVTVQFGGTAINGLARTFGERQPGELIALFGSNDELMISVVNGSAIEMLKPEIGDPVLVRF